MNDFGSECWFCHWGWAKQVRDIYERAKKDIDDCLPEPCEENDWTMWDGYPPNGEHALQFGPAHCVWSDENFDGDFKSEFEFAEWALYDDWYKPAMEIVLRSIRELREVPESIRYPVPKDYDGKHPEKYPPPAGLEMVKKR